MPSADAGRNALILVQKPDLVKPNVYAVTLTCERWVNTIGVAPMGISPVVGRLTLAQEAQVRILYPQPLPLLSSLSAERRCGLTDRSTTAKRPKNILGALLIAGWLE